MKTIKIDFSTYVVILLSFLAGNFKRILLTIGIVIFHELGHVFWLKVFKVPILEVKIYPFGGITRTNKMLNYSLNKELVIALGGIFNQVILYLVFGIFYKLWFINTYTYKMFYNVNTTLIIFNLIPMIPLDGGIIFHTLLNKFMGYVYSNGVYILVSIISFILFLVVNIKGKINILLIISFLGYKLIYFVKKRKYLENKFFLERYLYDLDYDKIIYENDRNIKKLKIGKYHYFNYLGEKKVLQEIFGGMDKN